MFLRNDTNTSHNHMSIPIQYQYHDFVRFQYQHQYQYLWDSFCNTETNTNTSYILLSIPIPIRYRKYRKFSISIPKLRWYRLVSHSTAVNQERSSHYRKYFLGSWSWSPEKKHILIEHNTLRCVGKFLTSWDPLVSCIWALKLSWGPPIFGP